MSTFSVYKGFKFSQYEKFFIFTGNSMNFSIGSDSYAEIKVEVFNNPGNFINSSVIINFAGTNYADMSNGVFTTLGPGASILMTAPPGGGQGEGLIVFEYWRYEKANIY